jgi:hypothetical protein
MYTFVIALFSCYCSRFRLFVAFEPLRPVLTFHIWQLGICRNAPKPSSRAKSTENICFLFVICLLQLINCPYTVLKFVISFPSLSSVFCLLQRLRVCYFICFLPHCAHSFLVFVVILSFSCCFRFIPLFF